MNRPLDQLASLLGHRLPLGLAVLLSVSWWALFAAAILSIGAPATYDAVRLWLAVRTGHDWLPSGNVVVPVMIVFTVLQMLHFDLIKRRDGRLATS